MSETPETLSSFFTNLEMDRVLFTAGGRLPAGGDVHVADHAVDEPGAGVRLRLEAGPGPGGHRAHPGPGRGTADARREGEPTQGCAPHVPRLTGAPSICHFSRRMWTGVPDESVMERHENRRQMCSLYFKGDKRVVN